MTCKSSLVNYIILFGWLSMMQNPSYVALAKLLLSDWPTNPPVSGSNVWLSELHTQTCLMN